MNLSVRSLWHIWTSLKRCEKKGFASLSSVVKFPSFLSKSSRSWNQPAFSWTLGTSESFCLSSSVQSNTPLCKPNMETTIILPPETVSGMMELDRGAFQKKISVPHVTVKSSIINSVIKCLKKYLLKLEKSKPVRTADDDGDKKEILLNPILVKSLEVIKKELGEVISKDEVTFGYREITLGYENWKAEDILKAVLPANQEGAQSFSIVGHILHLNLREHLLPYKTLIGEVYLDKVPNISMVVNKVNTIDSTYRNFQMEILGGTGDTVVTVKENGCSFTMDFARVYWNPRLSTEHGRVVGRLQHGDVLYDVMAGVGPFAVPAGRKKCHVLANDLNPESFNALVKNCTKNKVVERVKCFNMDGHDFIQTILKADLMERWKDPHFVGSVHITMNLPALAVTFLPSFKGLMNGVQEVLQDVELPVVHVYMFTKETAEDVAIGQVAENLGYLSKPSEVAKAGEVLQDGALDSDTLKNCEKSKSHKSYESLKRHVQEVIHVRQVAPNKAMMRVSFQLPLEVLLESSDEEPLCKKLKSS
ncbi:hypothetical protein O3P69_013639 [Scylla paramamosain]|uniref:tRNA (guanine(37)-N1)-methyltransferase n=2 Tax=Scylla paramamosain TaxID=85552 RepID=A0AAW0SP50_SCYPA